jgi:prolipoprotein diacylglyceryltransferase
MLYLGMVAGTYAGAAVASAEGLDATRFVLATVVLLVPALAGARLWFVLQHLELFRREPRRVWRRSEGGSSLYGGLVLGVAASVPVLALFDLPFWAFWDAASVTMLVGLILTRLGCLMDGCCGGRATAGPLGMRLQNHRGVRERRYPTQLLEAGWATVVLVVALAVHGSIEQDGALFACVVAAYAVGRLVLEPLREAGPGRMNLALSAALLVAALAFLA